jgi:hypothetical protein
MTATALVNIRPMDDASFLDVLAPRFLVQLFKSSKQESAPVPVMIVAIKDEQKVIVAELKKENGKPDSSKVTERTALEIHSALDGSGRWDIVVKERTATARSTRTCGSTTSLSNVARSRRRRRAMERLALRKTATSSHLCRRSRRFLPRDSSARVTPRTGPRSF